MIAVESSRELAWIRNRLSGPLPEAAGAAVIATNLTGAVAFWNKAAERLYGWSEDEAAGRDILELTPAKYTRMQSEQIMQALQAGEPWRGEILLSRRDGSPLVAFVLDFPFPNLAGAQGVIVGLSVPQHQKAAWRVSESDLHAALCARFGCEEDRAA